MLNEETKRKLRIMNMNPVIDIVDQQDSDVQTVALPFEQRFQRIVDFLYQDKYDEKVQRLIKSAHLRFPKADIHDIYYSPKRRINRDVMNELATCRYIAENRNIVLQGYTSSGKTYLGCALGKEACRQHYRTRYIRLPDLLDEVKEKATEVYGRNKLLKKFAAYDVLILDEWLMSDLKKDDVAFIFELSERRFDRTSTIFCTLYKKEEWIPRLGKGTFAESIYERFAAHDSIVIDTGEMNMREIFKNGTRRDEA